MALDTLKMLRIGLQVTQLFSPKVVGKIGARMFMTPYKVKRPEWESEVLTSSVATGRFEGCRYWVWGKTGPMVLCVHGWSGRGSQFGKFLPEILKSGFRVVAFDGPAHGDSRGKMANARIFADWCQRFSKKHGPFYAAIGHSFGGTAITLALSRGLEVQKVILIATPGDLHEIFDGFSRRLGFSEETRRYFYRIVQKKVGLPIEKVSPVDIVSEISAQAFILHDPGDREVSFEGVERMAAAWPRAKLIPIKGAGHYKILKSREAIDHVTAALRE